jgi:hypothetical protein
MSVKTGSILPLLATLLILSSSTLAGYALPDSSTERSGQLCEAHHRFTYNYKFAYADTLLVGESTTLKVTFTISGSEVTENPCTVTAKIIADGFDVSATTLDLSNTGTGTVTITPTKTGATLTVVTTLTLDGDYNRHRGYEATYTDTFTLDDFTITTESSSDTGTTNSTDTTSTTSGGTDTSNTTQTGGTTETDYPVEVVTQSLIPWYIVRATGLLAFITLSLSISIAALKKVNPCGYAPLFRHHCDISLLALVLTAIHLANNLLDSAVWRLTILDVLWVNLTSTTGIMISLGVVSFYAITAVTATSFKPVKQHIKNGNWLSIHLASYAAYIFVVLHSLYLGTDTVWGNNPLSQIYFIVFWGTTIINTALVLYALVKGVKKP